MKRRYKQQTPKHSSAPFTFGLRANNRAAKKMFRRIVNIRYESKDFEEDKFILSALYKAKDQILNCGFKPTEIHFLH